MSRGNRLMLALVLVAAGAGEAWRAAPTWVQAALSAGTLLLLFPVLCP